MALEPTLLQAAITAPSGRMNEALRMGQLPRRGEDGPRSDYSRVAIVPRQVFTTSVDSAPDAQGRLDASVIDRDGRPYIGPKLCVGTIGCP